LYSDDFIFNKVVLFAVKIFGADNSVWFILKLISHTIAEMGDG